MTDHLVPAAFFQPDRDPQKLIKYEDLSLRYIWDGTGDSDHHDLMTGVETNWYDVRRNMDRLPDFVNPETTPGYPEPLRARLSKWLDDRRTMRV
jgi:hypothetical protein